MVTTQAYARIIEPTFALAAPVLIGGAFATVFAVALVIFLSQFFGRPLREIAVAMDQFAATGEINVPSAAPGEIGQLSRAFVHMANDIHAKSLALAEEIKLGKEKEFALSQRGEALARAEDRFRRVVESAPSGMVMVDSHGCIQMINTEMEHLFGYRRDELLGKSIEILVPERFHGHHPSYRQQYHLAPEPRSMGSGRDLFGRRKDGSEFPVEIGLNPIQTAEGMQVLGVIVDITERKRAEAAIARYTDDLKRSNAELEQFAYIASHDLQEPLRMVASYTELLGERYRGQLDEKADKYIHYAVDGAKRMKLLINDLLTFSRVGTQGRPLVPVDAGQAATVAIDANRARASELQAEITCGPLPIVMADEIQLIQVFQNLVGNALKFHGDHPPQLNISLAARDNGMAEFTIADNGIGIEEKYADRVFQMFQRLHGRGVYEGNGIGLAIVKKIIERHGGKVWFESTPGHGTIFHFTLPLAKEEAT